MTQEPDQGREAWEERMEQKVAEHLRQLDYSDDEIQSIVSSLSNVEDGDATMSPSERVLFELLKLQGVDLGMSAILARTLLRIDMSKLTVTAAMAQDIVGVSNASLSRWRDQRRLVPAVWHSEGLRDRFTYWLPHVLYAIAWREDNPPTPGPGGRWLPDTW